MEAVLDGVLWFRESQGIFYFSTYFLFFEKFYLIFFKVLSRRLELFGTTSSYGAYCHRFSSTVLQPQELFSH